MRQLCIWLSLLASLGLILVTVPSPAADKKVDEAALKKLIEQLGADDFEARQQAQKELESIGVPAYEALKKAAADTGDPEVAMRAQALVERFEKEVLSARLLTPTRVHLKFKDTPLKDAVAELNKKGGCKISLYDPDNKLASQKVTLDTGDVTFWEAFDQFCEKANLVETSAVEVIQEQQQKQQQQGGQPGAPGVAPGGPVPLPAIPIRGGIRVKPAVIRAQPVQKEAKPKAEPKKEEPKKEEPKKEDPKPDAPPKDGAKQAEKQQARAKAVAKAQVAQVAVADIEIAPAVILPAQPVAPGIGLPGGPGVPAIPGLDLSSQVILKQGKPVKQATAYSGSFRLRTMGNPAAVFGNPDPKELLLGLQISAEPRLTIQGIQEVRITKAVDALDQTLRAPVVTQDIEAQFQQFGGFGGGGIVVKGRGIIVAPGMPAARTTGPATAPVKIVKGAKESKALKELSGVVEALVLTQPEAMLEAADVRKAGGKSFSGKEGGTMKVLAVSESNGVFTVRVEVDPPKNTVMATGLDQWNNPWGAVQIQGGMMPPGGGGFALPAQPAQPSYGFSLLDGKGTAVPHSGISVGGVWTPTGLVQNQYTISYKLAKGQEPGKLVWSGQRQAVIDIPFTFKDVPLK